MLGPDCGRAGVGKGKEWCCTTTAALCAGGLRFDLRFLLNMNHFDHTVTNDKQLLFKPLLPAHPPRQGLYVEMKFERPSKIQALTLPMILTPPHKDLIAQAHNGSGKTTCFVLSMLSR